MKKIKKSSFIQFLLTLFLSTSFSLDLPMKNPNTSIKFDFGTGKTAHGFIKVTGNMEYTKKRGYGFVSEMPVEDIDRGGKDALTSDFCTSNKPFYFVIDIPEGNYEVKITFGDRKGKSINTVKAESRRLMLKNIEMSPGEFKKERFTVNVRTPRINDKESIILKSRETNFLNWDNKLTLEFNGARPCIDAVQIKKVKNAKTVFLAGNSTVVDQEHEPWAAWGQMLPYFFKPGIVVANYAESGEAMKSFEREKRMTKILSLIQPGDYLFIQFGHNDQKPGTSYLEANTTYKEYLKKFVRQTREHKAVPVLISSMHRRKFDENGKIINTHGDYPKAMSEVAQEEQVPFIDLNAMSKVLYEALGIENSKKAFVHYPAGTFPGQQEELKDDSHHSTYGAYQLAKCIVKGIKANKLDLANYLIHDIEPYDPAHPDLFDKWNLGASPSFDLIKPDGY